ncbi:MAG: hypothetical protein M3Z64_10080, partial [Verrucomicrobiota bacterium]|nr:hypothetical protein [Verrucomicrobiota bacterium]
MSNATAVLDEVMEAEPPQTRDGASIMSGPIAGEGDHLPQWFQDQQAAAFETFQSLPAPNRKEQAWRFSNVDALKLDHYVDGAVAGDHDHAELLARSRGLTDVAARMIFADDHLVRRDPLPERLQKQGIVFQPLERALVEH